MSLVLHGLLWRLVVDGVLCSAANTLRMRGLLPLLLLCCGDRNRTRHLLLPVAYRRVRLCRIILRWYDVDVGPALSCPLGVVVAHGG